MQTFEQSRRFNEARFWRSVAAVDRARWERSRANILRKRGPGALDKLVDDMNKQRAEGVPLLPWEDIAHVFRRGAA